MLLNESLPRGLAAPSCAGSAASDQEDKRLFAPAKAYPRTLVLRDLTAVRPVNALDTDSDALRRSKGRKFVSLSRGKSFQCCDKNWLLHVRSILEKTQGDSRLSTCWNGKLGPETTKKRIRSGTKEMSSGPAGA